MQNKLPITMTEVPAGLNEENYEKFIEDSARDLGASGEDQKIIRQHLSEKSVEQTMLAQGRYFKNPYKLSYHRVQTIGCGGVQEYRVNPSGGKEDVGLHHEVKTIITKEGLDYHVFITPANYDTTERVNDTFKAEAALALIPYTVNPFNAKIALEKKLKEVAGCKVIVHFNDLAMLRCGFVYNNNGNNLYSCIVSCEDYVKGIKAAFGELERCEIILESEKFEKMSKVLRSSGYDTKLTPNIFFSHDISAIMEEDEDDRHSGFDGVGDPLRSDLEKHSSSFVFMHPSQTATKTSATLAGTSEIKDGADRASP